MVVAVHLSLDSFVYLAFIVCHGKPIDHAVALQWDSVVGLELRNQISMDGIS